MMREIKRDQYLRGTKAWTGRNIFVFGGIAMSLLFGAGFIFLFPERMKRIQMSAEEERREKEARKAKIAAIQLRRREMEEMRRNKAE